MVVTKIIQTTFFISFAKRTTPHTQTVSHFFDANLRPQESLSATYKKNSEANTKVFDLNQKTMQALDCLAGVYATCEEALGNSENENSAGDMLCADACGAMDELAKAQVHQARCQDEVKGCRESLDTIVTDLDNCRALLDQQHQDRLQEELQNLRENLGTAFVQLNNYRDLHDTVCRGLADAGTKTIDLKRKADDTHQDQIRHGSLSASDKGSRVS